MTDEIKTKLADESKSYWKDAGEVAFLAGCEALDKLYLESVPGFDIRDSFNSCPPVNDKIHKLDRQHFFAAAQRLQYFKNASQIAALQARVSQLEDELKHRGRECAENEAEVQRLTDQLKNLSKMVTSVDVRKMYE
jgi:hypothetical protein